MKAQNTPKALRLAGLARNSASRASEWLNQAASGESAFTYDVDQARSHLERALVDLDRIAELISEPDYNDQAVAIAYLTTDQETGKPTGQLLVPCSRYGRNGADCAPVAYAAAVISARSNGEPVTAEGLDYMMSLVVNDSDGPAELIDCHGAEYGFTLDGLGLDPADFPRYDLEPE